MKPRSIVPFSVEELWPWRGFCLCTVGWSNRYMTYPWELADDHNAAAVHAWNEYLRVVNTLKVDAGALQYVCRLHAARRILYTRT